MGFESIMRIKLLDADYIVEEGEVSVRLFCKNEKDETVLCIDREFLPYFYAVPEDSIEKLKEKIEETKFSKNQKELKIEEIEKKTLKDVNKEIDVLKVYTNIPANVTKLKNALWDLPETKECREFDIPFYRRYMIDKDLRAEQVYEVEGDTEKSEDFEQTIILEEINKSKNNKNSISWKTLAFDIEVYEDEVIMISLFSENYQKVLTTQKIDKSYVEVFKSEKKVLEEFRRVINDKDFDILTGYNTDEYDFQVLRERFENYNIEMSIGRNGERMKFNRRGRFAGARVKGRMHLDLYPFVSHVLSPGLDSERLDLDSVSEEILGMKKDEFSWEEMKESWRNKENLEEFADYALRDSELAYKLGEEMIPQILELARITGLIPFDACRLTYGQLTENYLLRESHNKKMIARNRPGQDERRKRQRQTAYEGGFVYEPEPGLYENIATLDFRSLYPTVMVSHNISPDTLNLEECDDFYRIEELDYEFCQDKQGFFPELIRKLVEDRYELKSKMRELNSQDQQYKSLDSEQKAKKILANSFYGYLGYEGARWYSRESAEATTHLGRKYIEETIEKAEKDGFEVSYGDSVDYSRQIIVKTPNGNIKWTKIGDFVENTEEVTGYETIAWDEEKEKAVFRPVKRAIMHEYEGKLLRFDTNRGRTKVTPQHSVYKYDEGEIKLADAENLKEGDCLVSLSEPPKLDGSYEEGELIDITELDYESNNLRVYKDTKVFPAERGKCPYCEKEYHLASHVYSQHSDRKTTLNQVTEEHSYVGGKNGRTGKIPRFWELSTEFAWILGFYCGDGSASTGSKSMISFGGQKKELIKRVKQFFDNILDEDFAIVESIDSRTGNKMYYYRIQRKPMVSLFVNGLGAGKGSEGKKVPFMILNADENIKRSFIDGYFEADGSLEKDHDSRYNSESMRFSTKSPHLANQVQYILKQMELGENGYGRKINDVSYKYREDKPKIRSIRNTAAQKPEFATCNFTPAPINKIVETEPEKDRVYDIEVEGNHNFVDAEGLILVHNTDSLFIRKPEMTEKQIEEFLKEVNEDLPNFMELEFEGMFERGFFTSTDSGEGAKKKYALIDDEGNMKITGFEQVRRDWSPIAKETQKRVLRKVLENNIDEAVEITKETIERLQEGKVPVEKLKIYTTLTKPPEEYQSTAPHVEAAKKAIKKGDEIEPETTIEYVITRRGKEISDKAKLVKYAEDYDAEYYIENQILPVTLRVLKVFGYTEGQLKGKGKQSGLSKFS